MLKMESQVTFTHPLHCRNIYERKLFIETPSDANDHGQRLLSLNSVQLSV